jgi:hypothetical protein
MTGFHLDSYITSSQRRAWPYLIYCFLINRSLCCSNLYAAIFKILFQSYYIYIYNASFKLKPILFTTCFDYHWSSSSVFKLFCGDCCACILPYNTWSIASSHTCFSWWCMSSAALKIESIYSSETWVKFCRITWHYIPENYTLYSNWLKNFTPKTKVILLNLLNICNEDILCFIWRRNRI